MLLFLWIDQSLESVASNPLSCGDGVSLACPEDRARGNVSGVGPSQAIPKAI
jgi:hypothetical protein